MNVTQDEALWAKIGHYLASRMQSHSIHMDGNRSYRFRGGWPELRGRTIEEAVLAAIEEEERAAHEMREKGGAS